MLSKRWFSFGLAVSWAISSAAWAGQTLYVTDSVVVELRSHAKSDGEVIGEVRTGDAVELLEEAKSYYKVKTSGGLTGWVEMKLFSQTPPMLFQMQQLQQTVAESEQQKRELEQQINQYAGDRSRFEEQAQQLQAERDRALAAVRKLEAQTLVPPHYFAPIAGSVALILYLIGYFFGVRRVRKQIKHRFGGLSL